MTDTALYDQQTYAGLDDFTKGYVNAGLWTSDPCPSSGEYQPDGAMFDAMDPEDKKAIVDDCTAFQHANAPMLALYYAARAEELHDRDYTAEECAGHDFYLTRCGHGVGFSDRGDAPCFDMLDQSATLYPDASFYWHAEDECESYRETGECSCGDDHEWVVTIG